jgi:hypothetical protein
VEAVASVEEIYDGIEPAVAVINLSDETDPQPVWDRLTRRSGVDDRGRDREGP